MDIWISILAVIAGIFGVVGSIVPGLPGVQVSWIGLLTLYIWGNGTNSAGNPMSLALVIGWAIGVIIITVLDYYMPPLITKKMGGSKYADKGALYGMILGIIFTPLGMMLGAFLGALMAELVVAKKKIDEAIKVALGAFLGFILGTGIKTITAIIILWQIIVYVR